MAVASPDPGSPGQPVGTTHQGVPDATFHEHCDRGCSRAGVPEQTRIPRIGGPPAPRPSPPTPPRILNVDTNDTWGDSFCIGRGRPEHCGGLSSTPPPTRCQEHPLRPAANLLQTLACLPPPPRQGCENQQIKIRNAQANCISDKQSIIFPYKYVPSNIWDIVTLLKNPICLTIIPKCLCHQAFWIFLTPLAGQQSRPQLGSTALG